MTALSNKALGGTYAGYDLDNLSVLVVDPSQAGRELLAATLKDVGVGTVRKVANGLQAIEYLKGARATFGTPANSPVDLVLTDIATQPVDGFMLLRWIRRHAESPNHFMRVVVISGGLNVDNIRVGRNLGVNDFIAKPFTLNSLRDRINAAIHTFRPFVLVSSYFGPDRRRHEMPPKQSERRTHADPIDPKRAPVAPASEEEAAGIRIFKIPNYLEAIVTGTGAQNLNFGALKKAEAEAASWLQDYADWTKPAIAFMERELAQAESADDSIRARALESIRREAFTMESTGLYLNYPAISAVAKSIARVLELHGLPWEGRSALLGGHLKALQMIAQNRLTGENNEAAGRLLDDLAAGIRAAIRPSASADASS